MEHCSLVKRRRRPTHQHNGGASEMLGWGERPTRVTARCMTSLMRSPTTPKANLWWQKRSELWLPWMEGVTGRMWRKFMGWQECPAFGGSCSVSQASVLFLLPFLSSVREDLIYNVLVSGIQQSDSVTHIHTATLFQCFVYFFKMKKVPLLLIHVVYVHFASIGKKDMEFYLVISMLQYLGGSYWCLQFIFKCINKIRWINRYRSD